MTAAPVEAAAWTSEEPDSGRSLVIEDDGRVAYAYLYAEPAGPIVSCVWLYNRDGIEADPPWDDPEALPFPNKRAFMTDEALLLTDTSVVMCAWDARGVELYIDGVRTARLEPGITPGWSRLAAVASEVATPFGAHGAPRS